MTIQQRERFSVQSGFDPRSSQRGSYFDYLVDSEATTAPDTSVTSVIDPYGEKLQLSQHVS